MIFNHYGLKRCKILNKQYLAGDSPEIVVWFSDGTGTCGTPIGTSIKAAT